MDMKNSSIGYTVAASNMQPICMRHDNTDHFLPHWHRNKSFRLQGGMGLLTMGTDSTPNDVNGKSLFYFNGHWIRPLKKAER